MLASSVPLSESTMSFRHSWVFAFLLASCGDGSTAADGSSGSSGAESDEMGEMVDEPVVEHRGSAIDTMGITPPDRPWAEMSHEDRELYMVGKVLPVMNEIFRRKWPERYPAEGISCATCHGEHAEETGFRMPSGHLIPIPRSGTPAATAFARRMADSIEFMEETIEPAMGTLLGMDEYRCSGCHTSTP